mmetsp:Transcript_57747/g.130844  ORF Transcript_57747/g.130844 Transcript_57747/m.130844 type:complete len:221 (-) Transcript_57747:360-1022(-)
MSTIAFASRPRRKRSPRRGTPRMVASVASWDDPVRKVFSSSVSFHWARGRHARLENSRPGSETSSKGPFDSVSTSSASKPVPGAASSSIGVHQSSLPIALEASSSSSSTAGGLSHVLKRITTRSSHSPSSSSSPSSSLMHSLSTNSSPTSRYRLAGRGTLCRRSPRNLKTRPATAGTTATPSMSRPSTVPGASLTAPPPWVLCSGIQTQVGPRTLGSTER